MLEPLVSTVHRTYATHVHGSEVLYLHLSADAMSQHVPRYGLRPLLDPSILQLR